MAEFSRHHTNTARARSAGERRAFLAGYAQAINDVRKRGLDDAIDFLSDAVREEEESKKRNNA